MTSTVFPEDIGTDYKCPSELLSVHTVRRWIQLALPHLLKLKIKNISFKEKKETNRNTETFVKIGFAKISLAVQKILVAQNLGRGRGGGLQPPTPPTRTLMSALSPVSSIKHIIVAVKFDIIETCLQRVPSLNVDRFWTHHLKISFSLTCGVWKGLCYFRMDPKTWIPKSS